MRLFYLSGKSESVTSWYEKGLFWGCTTSALAIILVVVAAMLKDLRWLLIFVLPLAGISWWIICKETRNQILRWVLFAALLAVTVLGLWQLYNYHPKSILSGGGGGKPNKPTAVVEIAGYDNSFNPNEKQILSVVHAENLGPDIARNVQGIVWTVPAILTHHEENDDWIEGFFFSRMLDSFRKSKAQHPFDMGRSLALGQSQDFSWVSPPIGDDDYKKWKNMQDIVYLIAEISWQDDAGNWKTDLCERLYAPIKIPNKQSAIGVHATCGEHNGVAEPLPHN